MKSSLIVALFVVAFGANAQKYKSTEGSISFFSEASIEDISASNVSCTGLLDLTSRQIAFRVTITEFEFAKSLMQQHFNDKYMESDKFPIATFAGTISGFDASSLLEQKVTARGILTIHGQANEIEVKGSIKNESGALKVKSNFIVALTDYKIKIPKLLWQNIAEEVEVKVDFKFEEK